MGRRNNPVQSVRRRHVDATIEQPVDESRVLCSVRVLAVVAVVMNGVASGEVKLKHRAEALHDGVNLSSAKNITQTGNGGIANRIDLLVNTAIIRRKQIQ